MPQLMSDPNCLLFFVDETGHEEPSNPNYPVFGLEGRRAGWRRESLYSLPRVPCCTRRRSVATPCRTLLWAIVLRRERQVGKGPPWVDTLFGDDPGIGSGRLHRSGGGTAGMAQSSRARGWLRDFPAILHSNPIWSSLIDIDAARL